MSVPNGATAARAPWEAGMFIGGEHAGGTARLEVRNPAHPDELVGTIVRGTPRDVDRAIDAARRAQVGWGAKTFVQRAQAIERALSGVMDDVSQRARLYVRENGKTLAEATRELSDVGARARHTLALASRMDDPRTLPSDGGETVVRHLPYGVVVSIVPWNAPVSLGCMQIIPALLAGNAVVVKAPESCPLTLIQTVKQVATALPPGLLNIVTGLPGEIGDALTTHPAVGKIAFTGSIPSARGIIAKAGQSIKSVTAELGGNDPAIVMPDADLGRDAMRRMATIVFRMTGQVCMAIKRIYVPEAMHDHFVEAFIGAANEIVTGDGLIAGVTMGPLHTRQGLERALALLGDAERRGAKLRSAGRVDDAAAFAAGHFMRPTIVTELEDAAPLVNEEQFCAAVPILRYRGVEDALARANDTIFGLGGSVWGRDVDAAAAIARQIQAGTVFVNTHGTNSVNRLAPYGGIKQSGSGRRAGAEGLLEYLQSQTLTTIHD